MPSSLPRQSHWPPSTPLHTVNVVQQSIAKTLLPAYRVQNVEFHRIERFKTELARLLEHLEHAAAESEEHLKNLVSDFLKAVWYRDEHFVNTKDRQDLVIHHGRTAKDSVGVILEAKRPKNKAEMFSPENPNAKALHELLRYYLDERSHNGNKDIRHLIITDIHRWYIFDAADFERHIYANAKFLQQYTDWREGRLGAGTTDWFYKEIAAPFFEKELPELRCCTFDLRDYAAAATNNDPADDETLLDLFKILSPQHLLKKPFANDSNTLNRQFYDELLYILGLEEVKQGGRKLIERADKRRCDGSLIENTLSELDISGVWRDATDLDSFGDTPEKQRFSIALELCITWLNRILFLKLLEGQLLRWRPGSDRLLSLDKVKDYDELNELFFHVLAVPEGERRESVHRQFGNVPYLNSSLFEQTELERRTLRISALKDRLDMPVHPNSALRHGQNPPKNLQTLAYLFAFLDAYDFSSDAKARIQAENRPVINAAVLGLIFEKINGYRDGSFFTPGFVTMYMCRETLRRAVLQKFNERYGWDCADVETDLHNELLRHRVPLPEANALVNSLRVCDPAVGSGHFLVSALNELIAIKSDLGILCDPAGKLIRLRATVGNDELILTDPDTDLPVEYRPGIAASQRIQETLFREKQTLIENCLFGVDINPKSVMICRLRLWIELLKHAYFKTVAGSRQPVDGTSLETLPNIDINIKAGNSLISRFALDSDLKGALKSIKYNINDYRNFVRDYKTSTDREVKRGLLLIIDEIKNNFRTEIGRNDPKVTKLQKLTSELYHRFTGHFLFEPDMTYGGKKYGGDSLEAKRQQAKAELEQEIAKLSAEIQEIKNNRIFKNAFEWRFEFPEVLDDDGRFRGFDVVLGNPPYIRQEELGAFKEFFQAHFETWAGTADLYVYFVERGMAVLRPGGQFAYILPNKWMRAGYGDRLRHFLRRHRIEGISDFGDLPVFDEATTYPCILELSRAEALPTFRAATVGTLDYEGTLGDHLRPRAFTVALDGLNDSGWTLTDQTTQRLLDKLRAAGTPLGEYVQGKIYYGIKTGLNEAFVIDAATRERLLAEDPNSAEIIKPFLAGREIKKYRTVYNTKFLLFCKRGIDLKKFPAIQKHLLQFKNKLEPKPKNYHGDDWGGRKEGSYQWFEVQDSIDYFKEFECPKILFAEIATEGQFTYDALGQYCDTTGYIIGSDSKYLIGILNSRLVTFFFSKISSEIRGGFLRWKRQYVEQIPIPDISEEAQQPLIALATRILAAKRADPQADTSALEAEVDALVYGLYGLSAAEVAVVEGR